MHFHAYVYLKVLNTVFGSSMRVCRPGRAKINKNESTRGVGLKKGIDLALG